MTELTELVGTWMRRQRWYSTKNVEPRLRLLGSFDSGPVDARPGDGDVRITTYFFCDDAPRTPRVYQVPVVARAGRDGEEAALIGEAGGRYLYDGPTEEAYVASLVRLMTGAQRAEGRAALAEGHSLGGPLVVRSSRRLTGEQSNTSIVGELEGGRPALIKVFRVVQDGENPDVSTLAALTAGGSRRTPSLLGWLTGRWPTGDGGIASGELALMQDFLPGAEDGWELAVSAAEHGEDFTDRAFQLGAGTAELHRLMAHVLPTKRATREDVGLALDGMFRRLAVTTTEVPEVEELRAGITAVYEEAAAAPLPLLQRIHGDLHLGQVLYSPERGWQFIDFEGEPLRPLSERAIPDATMRDVAGMLRSFDYVAGSLARRETPIDATGWTAAARAAYLDGYASVAGSEVEDFEQLLDAFELDKAVYEIAYEARHRPSWIPIPLAAVQRLLAARALEL
ncbi:MULTISPECIES: phosphotransferase [unclassified Leifsonia]|uniref:maltokinase N-terminal cap-like domain-containing protein n=1 Tax=unclassified Leifsonia TaxID=2663824 RepID=UPI0008A742D3|nr:MULTISPECIES: phosphotransferase [unclassified Leifsonia]SEI12523.1 Predicted trehalose synthase [Leifsonia sp. CL154]SFL97410.1 Predicted trehalose synthase [Leifsonia sp. CL147]